MGTTIDLLNQFSIETIILMVLGLAITIKLVGELWEWFYNKIKKHFDFKTQDDQKHSDIIDGIQELKESLFDLRQNVNDVRAKLDVLEVQEELTVERLQENTRSFLIDKHHYFVYKIKAIDDLNLQSIERRYLYYKGAGGDSFIDGLMEDIRNLPKISIQNMEHEALLLAAKERDNELEEV